VRRLAPAAAVWLTTTPAMALAAGRKDPKLAAPVAAYGTALATVLAEALLLEPSPGGRRSTNGVRMVQAGAALFVVSDALIGARTFAIRRPAPALDAAVMATYTAGQGLIAAGAARIADAGRDGPQP
jgi:uncharacterized membrane protein YhhN